MAQARVVERIEVAVADISCNFNAFLVACVVVLIWAGSGHYYHYSDTWQLVINTGTTIITFLMAFLIGANQQRSNVTNTRMLQIIERHAALIEDQMKIWQRHIDETHSIAQATHALVRSLHTEKQSDA